jgi:hypothetical protein
VLEAKPNNKMCGGKMKLSIFSFAFLFLITVWGVDSYAQRTVNVPAGFSTINNVIGGDTTATGERVDANTVYILERDGLYILDGEFSPNYPCIIEAAPGSGSRPRVILGVPSGGTTPEQAFRPRADFRMKGVYVSALDELGGVGTRIFRFEENGIKIDLEDCHLDIASQAAFRINTSNNTLYMKNCIISNIGVMASPENGRAFDDRGNDVDTLWIENCTFYNLTFKILRDGGGRIDYAFFNHNTSVNTGFGAIDLGETRKAYIANNIIINPAFLGSVEEVPYAIILSPWTGTETQEIIIKNNNVVTDAALLSAYPDSVNKPVNYDSLSAYYITQNGSTNIEEFVTFTDGPSSPVSVITTYWNDPSATQESLDTLGHESFDFSYASTYQSYTGGTSGQPIGDISWFGLTPTSVNNYMSAAVPASYSLYNNYPNPFNPSTKIRYSIPFNSHVSLKIYDILGKEVAVLINSELQPGTYEAVFDAANLSSGIYFYKLETPSFVQTNKMILLK